MSNLTNQVVYTALTRMTDDREIIKQAFVNWHNTFANQALDVFKFVDHIDRFLGLDTGEKKALMVSMHASASKTEDELKAIPAYILGSSDGAGADSESPFNVSVTQNAGASAETDKAPYILLAQSYVNKLLAATKRANSKHGQELLEILAEEGLPQAPADTNARLKSLSSTDLSLPQTTSESGCKDLCHELYMLVCEVHGPNQADDLSYKVVAELLNSNEASRYDPRSLLD